MNSKAPIAAYDDFGLPRFKPVFAERYASDRADPLARAAVPLQAEIPAQNQGVAVTTSADQKKSEGHQ